MKLRLDENVWEVILANMDRVGETLEVLWLDSSDEYVIACETDIFEEGFESEVDAENRKDFIIGRYEKFKAKNKIRDEILQAINKYTVDCVDITIECDCVYGIYHSSNNSFDATRPYDTKLISVEEARSLAYELDVGYFEVENA